MRILCVDDERSVHQMLQLCLRQHTVDWAPDAATALTKLAEPFDLVITDGTMPGMSGPSLAVKIRGRVPVLGLTASHIAARQFETIGVPCLTKPFAMAELEQAIEDVTRERKTTGAWGWG